MDEGVYEGPLRLVARDGHLTTTTPRLPPPPRKGKKKKGGKNPRRAGGSDVQEEALKWGWEETAPAIKRFSV
jgi:hypothetical protein